MKALRQDCLCRLRDVVSWIVAGYLCIFATATTNIAAASSSWTLEQLQRDALLASPDLQSLTHRIEASRAAARQAGRWQNPELFASVDKEEHEVALAQQLDVWGKMPIARKIAFSKVGANAAKLATARLDLLHGVATQYWILTGADRSLALLDEELADWKRLIAIYEGEIAAGEIAMADMLAIRTLVAQRQRERWRLLARSSAARAALNVATGRPANATLEIETPHTNEALATKFDGPQGVIEQALARNPFLALIRAKLESSGLRIRQERLRWAPDPKVGLFIRNAPEETFEGVTLSFSLPLFDRNQDGIHAAVSDEAALQADLRGAELALAQEAFIAFQLHSQAREAFDELSAFSSGPLARQRQLSRESFELGAISESDLLAARIEWTQLSLELESLRTNLGLADTRLRRVLATNELGTDITWIRND